MDAFDEILSKLPPDFGGSTADNGFSFQKNWALMKLLELEDSGSPYTIIFDYHDDIEVLDSDDKASNIDFYQIKTSVNYWQIGTLCKKGKGDDGKIKKSFLGKLIKHFLEFENTRDVFFVTNNYLSKTFINTEKKIKNNDVLQFSMLTDNHQKDIRKKIKEELEEDIPDECYEHLYIIQNQLNLNDSTSMLIGKVSTFLQKHLRTSEISPNAFYVTMIAEVTKRNDYKQICKSKEDLFSHKAITKKQFKEFINGLRDYSSFDSKFHSVINELKDEIPFKQRTIIQNNLKDRVKNEYFQYDNIEFRKLSNIIKTVINNIEIEDNDTFWSYGCNILSEVKQKYPNPLQYDDDFILSFIFYLIYE